MKYFHKGFEWLADISVFVSLCMLAYVCYLFYHAFMFMLSIWPK